MPLYTISTAKPFPYATREAIARRLTQLHCDHTGAPPDFVTVMFWTHVPLPEDQDANVFGSVRAGRSRELNAALERDICAALSELGEVAPGRTGFSLFEIPAHQVMEGGAVLPEPGDESAWLASHRDH